MIDKMYVNYGDKEKETDIVARSSENICGDWCLIDSTIDKRVPGYFKGKHGFFKDKHVNKHYTANFSNQFVEQGTKGRCIREKHVNEVGYLLLVNFGNVSIWCIERDLIEGSDEDEPSRY